MTDKLPVFSALAAINGTRLLQISSMLLILGVLASTSHTLARLTWTLLEPVPVIFASPKTPAPRQQAVPEASLAQNIEQLHLFGKPAPPEEPQSVSLDEVQAPETRMRLRLEGVFLSEVPEYSSAFIAEQSRPGERYTIGDRVSQGVTLAAVFADRVLLQRGEAYETLRFPDSGDSDSGIRAETPANASRSSRPSARRAAADIPADLTASQQLTENIQQMDAGSFMETYMPIMQTNPQAILDGAGLEPRGSSGESRGYTVGAQAPAALMSQLGLQQGDVIVSVNSHPVGDVQRDRQLINQIVESGVARIEIQRGQRTFVVTYPLR
ncbi:hypothetical protein LGV61_06715 [Desulfurispirillum indicum]|uniref:General secretion pathway protein C n=1 Tax=Desulfurispirillum indicum (strain ATCC BAA-1389 / DSM 22839 / S5) TaxID=653733 RepID=E6W544_DESIS|nr:type II secretion system protein N [Desulfurispirillum indicum]ADU66020.1 general secretion pathway protein C [Desulfurispirillum indicum S5]UCZ57958.1 hypothetical protein LGV61_06715 [Desulfurispirillum indicum]